MSERVWPAILRLTVGVHFLLGLCSLFKFVFASIRTYHSGYSEWENFVAGTVSALPLLGACLIFWGFALMANCALPPSKGKPSSKPAVTESSESPQNPA